MAETFGEADVILRARLEELQKDLDAGERMVNESTERVQDAQVRAARQTREANEAGGGFLHTLGNIAMFANIATWLRRLAMRFVVLTAAVKITTSAVSALMSVLVVPIAVVASLGHIIRFFRHLPENIRSAVDALKDLDFREMGAQGALAFRNISREIPVLGLLIKGLETTISEVSELLGGPNWTREIEALEEATKRAEQAMDEMGRAADRAGTRVRDAMDISRAEERRRQLEGMQGADRIRMEEMFHREDIERQAIRDAQSYNEKWRERMNELREQISGAAGIATLGLVGIDEEEFEARADVLNRERNRVLESIRKEKDKALREAEQTARQRERDARRDERFGVANQEIGLGSSAAAARLRAAGEEFNAQRLEIEAARSQALNNMVIEGNEDQLGLIEDFYNARQELINAREEEQLQREREFQQRREEQERKALERKQEMEERKEFETLQTNERLRSQIMQHRLQQAGDEVAARQEAIRQRFQEQIDQLERDGNRVGADLAQKLRDLELEAAGAQDRGRQASFRDVSRDRIQVGQGITDEGKRQRDAMIAELRKINQNTEDDGEEFG